MLYFDTTCLYRVYSTEPGHGFTEVHSNDLHFLAAATLFGLRGVSVIP